jgi:RNA polymerase sigma-70 factor (ECF subfamily)
MHSRQEEQILLDARTGSREAFDSLCALYHKEIYGLCYRFLGGREDAEDAVQDVFARAWQRLETYRSEASFRTWLWQIARNLCLNNLRARKSSLQRRTRSFEALPYAERQETLDIPDTRPSPEQIVQETARVGEIRAQITRYAQEKKWGSADWELFLLRIERDIAYAEFARRHGRDEAYWRNRWRDKIKPVLERVRDEIARQHA